MASRSEILDLARAYDSLGTSDARYELLDAIDVPDARGFRLPGGGLASSLYEAHALRLWVAAARRADASTRGPGQPSKGRPHRRMVRTTDATEAGLLKIAEAAGRGVPDVASELLEDAVKAKGGCDE